MNWQRNLLGPLRQHSFLHSLPRLCHPTAMMEKISYVMEAGGQKHLSPASPEHLPEASLTLGKARSQREICLCVSVSDLWCGLCTCLSGCMHVCV